MVPRRVAVGITLVASAVSVTGCSGIHSRIPGTTTMTGPTAISTSAGPRTVLPPAMIAAVSAECTLALTHDADGNVRPLLCPNGGLNVAAWQWYAKRSGQQWANDLVTDPQPRSRCNDNPGLAGNVHRLCKCLRNQSDPRFCRDACSRLLRLALRRDHACDRVRAERLPGSLVPADP